MTAPSTNLSCTQSATQTVTIDLVVTVIPSFANFDVSVDTAWTSVCTKDSVIPTRFTCTKQWSGTSNIPFTAVLTNFKSGGEHYIAVQCACTQFWKQ